MNLIDNRKWFVRWPSRALIVVATWAVLAGLALLILTIIAGR
jgi:hypothetical protein